MAAPPRETIPRLSELTLEVTTPRLVLRPYRDSDVDDIWPYVSDPEFPKHMSWAAHADKAQTLEFLAMLRRERAANESCVWAIEHAGKVVGTIGLDTVWRVAALRVDRAELGYWLAPTMWGKGLMTEAAHHALAFAFAELGLHKVTTRCFEPNIASRRVMEKVGFRHVGRLEDDAYRDGRWYTQLLYELTAERWSDVSTTMPISRPRPT